MCPENGLYPGYYTEKIPEAFYSGCLPITWADENIVADFNSRAFLNLEPLFKNLSTWSMPLTTFEGLPIDGGQEKFDWITLCC